MKQIIAFVLGATAGSLITWKLLERKYKQIADEEIESVREYYRGRDKAFEQLEDDKKRIDDIFDRNLKEQYVEEKTSYNKLVTDLGYASDDATLVVDQGDESIAPYVIAPEEFGDMPGFDTESWTYYADGIVANDDNEIISDLENIIGDGLEHFGEYEDDSVCVRNENLRCDYEILKHNKTFGEILNRSGSRDDG